MATVFKIKLYSSKEDKNKVNNSLKIGGLLFAAGKFGHKKFLKESNKNINKFQDSNIYRNIKNEIINDAGTRVNLKRNFTGKPGSFYNSGKNIIYMNNNGVKNYVVLSHEAGHAHYTNGSGKGIGKLAHTLDHTFSPKIGDKQFKSTELAKYGGIISGALTGIRAAKLEKEGKKQSKLERNASWLIPAIISTPILIKEAAASKYGIDLLKKSGANKETIREAQKELLTALGSYGGKAISNIGLSELSRGIAYTISRKFNK